MASTAIFEVGGSGDGLVEALHKPANATYQCLIRLGAQLAPHGDTGAANLLKLTESVNGSPGLKPDSGSNIDGATSSGPTHRCALSCRGLVPGGG